MHRAISRNLALIFCLYPIYPLRLRCGCINQTLPTNEYVEESHCYLMQELLKSDSDAKRKYRAPPANLLFLGCVIRGRSVGEFTQPRKCVFCETLYELSE